MNLLAIARRPLARVCLALTALALAGCATAPSHPALQAAQADASLAPLVPMRRFVANVDAHGGFALSPDGQQLLWFRVVGTDAGLAARGVDQPDRAARRFATGHLARRDLEGGTYGWLPDSRHAYYVRDPRGDEATQIHVVDTRSPAATPWPVTPWPGARSTVVARGEPGSARFFFASNRRDKATFDLYEADAATRTVREVARSDGRVTGWLIGTDRQSIGSYSDELSVHVALLGYGVAVLENLDLRDVPDGRYTLYAAPLKISGAEGAPCRAILVAQEAE